MLEILNSNVMYYSLLWCDEDMCAVVVFLAILKRKHIRWERFQIRTICFDVKLCAVESMYSRLDSWM